MESYRINLERFFPEFLNEAWNVETYAEKCGCSRKVCDAYLAEKRQEITTATSGRVVGIAVKTWNSLERRAVLDRDTLDDLNERQSKGEEVSDKLVSSVVKRLIALINMGKSMNPNTLPFPGQEDRLIGGSLNRK